jgi:hypothetical protein
MKSILTIIFITLCSTINAQWLPDVRLTNDAASSTTSPNSGKCIAAKGDTLHVVFKDNRDGNNEIYYKRSTNNGSSWGVDTRLTNNSSFSDDPTITVSGNTVSISWRDFRDENDEIYYKRSTDAGTTWSSDTRLTNNTFEKYNPAISSFGQIVCTVWNDLRHGRAEIYYKRSTNGGANWGVDTRLTVNDSSSLYPSISMAGQVVHVSWVDRRYGNDEIMYRVSPDGGLTWLAETRISNDTSLSGDPFATGIGQNSFVFWGDTRDGNQEIYFRKSTNLGTTWGPETRLTNDFSASGIAQAEIYGKSIHLIFSDTRDANVEIYYKHSSNLGANWGPDTRITNDAANSYYPSISLSGQNLHLVWIDDRDGNNEIYYKKNPTGNVITGIVPISQNPESYSLEQNYPNPFNPATNIKFTILKSGVVKLKVYDILGKEMAVLVNKPLNAGSYQADFNGSSFASGVYFYKLETEGFTEIKKMMLVK